jgi:hypothetical protein
VVKVVGLGRLITGIVGLNPARGMDVYAFVSPCVVCKQRPLRWANHSFRGVLPRV